MRRAHPAYSLTSLTPLRQTGRVNEALVDKVANARFTPVRMQEGYDMGEVDRFLDRLCERLSAGEPIAGFVARARFTPTKIREGYAMGDVDDFLDRVVAEADVTTGLPETTAPPAAAPPAASPPEVASDLEWTNPISEVRSPLARLFARRKDR